MTKAQRQQEEAGTLEARESLRKSIDRKEGIVLVLKSVSKSGMKRSFDVYTRGLKSWLNYDMCKVLGFKQNDNGEIIIKGAGMDMAFFLAYQLTQELYTEEERKELTGNGGGYLPFKTI